MKVELEREEILACIVCLEEAKRLGEWGRAALAKLLKVMGMK